MADLMVFCRILPGGTGLNTASLTGAMTTAAQFGFWGSVLASVLSVTSLIIPAALWTSVIARFEKTDSAMISSIVVWWYYVRSFLAS